MLTFDRANEVLSYDPATGVFRWRVRTGPRNTPGTVAGYRNAEGYWHIQIDGRKYLGHRLAWLLVKGVWPEHRLDHKDTNKANNRWENLRPCEHVENMFNQSHRASNSLRLKGVSKRPNGKFQAMIQARGVSHYLGVFDTPEQANEAYSLAATRLHGEFARSN